MKKFTITILLLLLLLPLSAEAKVKFQYTNGVPVVAEDYCSKIARKATKKFGVGHYIEFCNYSFQPLDNETSFYYIILIDDTYFVTTSSKAYVLTVAAIQNKTYDSFFRAMLKSFIVDGTFGSWNVLGNYELHPIFGPTFVPNRNMLETCWKNKKNRYYFSK